MSKLDEARKQINEIDQQMANLFAARMKAVELVAAHKKEHGLPILDTAREEEVIRKNAQYMKDEALKSYYVNFLKYNMSLSRSYQHRLLEGMLVAYSGVPGAFADIAAQKIFPDGSSVPYKDFKAAYEAVVNGECDCAVLPIENSYQGDVSQVMDLAFFGSLSINGIYDMEIVQNLVGVDGASVRDVKEVISHPQALGQCADYIRDHDFLAHEATNTAVSARKVAEEGRKELAAIASAETAALYGLKVLDKSINASSINTTRFAVFSRYANRNPQRDNYFVLNFTVKNEAGGLGKAVSAIGDAGFNLRALKSRPSKELIWEYYFFAEGEGNINSPEGEGMLEELKKHCSQVKIVGAFEKEQKLER
ncbi:MAG: chorismate mutase [Clostridia bacterium]|nr:chorismate mutase [Clostridia bacterium]